MKKSILVFRDYYLPGYKSGGPIQSISNLVTQLGDEYHFKIITADRDEGDPEPYSSVDIDAWNEVGKARVYYLSSSRNPVLAMAQLLDQTDYDQVYLNSFFSARYTIVPLVLRRLGLVPNKPVVVAPRGELSAWALGLKAPKKRVFMTAARAFGLYDDVLWQASDDTEADQIRRHLGSDAEVMVAAMPLPYAESTAVPDGRVGKESGRLEVGFLGRISPIKQVELALEVLARIQEGQVRFHIHGPAEDPHYFEHCRQLAGDLPANVEAIFHGPLPHPEVDATLRGYDLMFMPSRSESFGHAILESLLAYCPVLIGRDTPWRGLADKKAGWDISLDNEQRLADTLRRVVAMDADELSEWHRGARQLAVDRIEADDTAARYDRLFSHGLGHVC